jgi:hypothetical protein
MLDLKKWGQVNPEKPRLATAFEFVSLWSHVQDDPSALARLCAGAIGVCIDKHHKLPAYKPQIMTPKEYGYKCLDRLLDNGFDSTVIFQEGSKALTFLAESLPRGEEIEDNQNF